MKVVTDQARRENHGVYKVDLLHLCFSTGFEYLKILYDISTNSLQAGEYAKKVRAMDLFFSSSS